MGWLVVRLGCGCVRIIDLVCAEAFIKCQAYSLHSLFGGRVFPCEFGKARLVAIATQKLADVCLFYSFVGLWSGLCSILKEDALPSVGQLNHPLACRRGKLGEGKGTATKLFSHCLLSKESGFGEEVPESGARAVSQYL